MENTPVILSANISIGYGGKKPVTVADNLSLALKKGTLTALIGANGIGKSTLLRTLSGLQKPLKGEVLIGNKNLSSYSRSALAQQLSLVLTESPNAGNLTVFELVSLGRQPYTNWLGSLTPNDIAKINQALALTQTQHLADKKYFEISDGQLQNVMIARALAQDTPVIILDEPTTHLDLPHKIRLIKLLKKLAAEENKCILFSTHDLDLALQMADELVIMKKGCLVQGSPETLINSNGVNNIFDDESIVFDTEKRMFVVKG
ncbi:ABC transporter ATP-binding protein [Flavobacterium sp. RHBU_24]|uniref:ABC transporter ATP-binding protein n=1 Tax=Flavobacterium sp. RHBU_24 TaxID=3391185 RepID=UPI00398525D7